MIAPAVGNEIGKPLLDNSSLEEFASELDHPEAVCWMQEERSVLAGGEAGQLYSIPVEGGVPSLIATIPGGELLGIAVDGDGATYVCDPQNHCVHRVIGGVTDRYVHDIGYPNYPAFGPDGSLWVTDSGVWDGPSGSLLRVWPDGQKQRINLPPLAFANGLAIDDEAIYLVESALPGVRRIPLDQPEQAELLVTLPRTVPDGLAIDIEGALWISCFQPNRIYRLTSDGVLSVALDDWSGEEFLSPTNVAFVGPRLDRLVLASLCGRTLKMLDPGVAGRPLYRPPIRERSSEA